MINAKLMYLRPGNMFKAFIILTKTPSLNSSNKPVKSYSKSGNLSGCLADADAEVKSDWKQRGHTISHVIVQKGKPKVKIGDSLEFDGRFFLVHGFDDMGSLGIAVQYFCEERYDLQ